MDQRSAGAITPRASRVAEGSARKRGLLWNMGHVGGSRHMECVDDPEIELCSDVPVYDRLLDGEVSELNVSRVDSGENWRRESFKWARFRPKRR